MEHIGDLPQIFRVLQSKLSNYLKSKVTKRFFTQETELASIESVYMVDSSIQKVKMTYARERPRKPVIICYILR